MKAKTPFKPVPGAPSPLQACFTREIRFEEVDPLGIVWHGRYASYFDDGRLHLGKRYGFGYLDFYDNKIVAPVKQLHIDYIQPLSFGDTVCIETSLHYTEASRLNYTFLLRNASGEITTTGYSVQLFLDASQELLLCPPPFYADILQQWKQGTLTPAPHTAHTGKDIL